MQRIFYIVVLVVCMISGVSYAQNSANKGVLVSATKPNKDVSTDSTKYVGTVIYYAVSNIASERAGKIDHLYVDEAQYLTKGSKMVLLNSDILLLSIKAQKARVLQSEALLTKSKLDLDRDNKLFKGGGIPAKSYEQSVAEYTVKLNDLEVSKAELGKLEEEHKRSIVHAPFDAIVLKRHVANGEWVNVGTPLYELASSRMQVEVRVPVHVLGYVRVGEKVVITAGDRRSVATVTAIIPQGSNVSRTYPIKLDLASDSVFLPGMDVSVEFITGRSLEGYKLPRDTVISKDGQDFIFYIDDDNIAKQLLIKVVRYEGINVYIDILTEDADILNNFVNYNIITRGNESVRHGSAIRLSDK